MSFKPDFSLYESLMTKDELLSDMWLFVYEMLAREWFKPVARQNPVKQNECFNFLLRAGVKFYDDSYVESIMASDIEELEPDLGGLSG